MALAALTNAAGTPIPYEAGYPIDAATGRREPNARQALASACPADILFYGGAVGGGKTDFLVTEAQAVCLKYPGIEAFLFRRTREELKLAILHRLLTRIPRQIARWVKNDHCFYFFNGAILYLEFLERDEDVYRYQSAEMGWAGIDEVGQLNEFPASYLMSRVRSTNPTWPRKLRLAGNPDGVGVGWLKRWFITPSAEELGGRMPPDPEQIWRPLPKPGDPSAPELIPTRCFIPARFADNVALQRQDPGYLARVYQINKTNVATRLAEGLWDIDDSMIVGGVWRATHIVGDGDLELRARGYKVGAEIFWHVVRRPTWRPPVGAKIYGSIDYGYGVPWSFHLHAAMAGGHVRTFYELYAARVRDEDQAKRINDALATVFYEGTNTSVVEGLEWVVYDPSMKGSREEMGLAKSIIEVYRDVLGDAVPLLSGAGGRSARTSRPNRWLAALATAADGYPYWSVTTACPDLIRTVPEVPWDPDDPDVEDDASESHCYEDVGRFFEARPIHPKEVERDKYAHLDPLSRALHEADDEKERASHRKDIGGFAYRPKTRYGG